MPIYNMSIHLITIVVAFQLNFGDFLETTVIKQTLYIIIQCLNLLLLHKQTV